MSPRNREQPQMPPGWLENTVAQLPRTCGKCFRTRLSPGDERPAVNSAIKRTMCSGLLQANVILTLLARRCGLTQIHEIHAHLHSSALFAIHALAPES